MPTMTVYIDFVCPFCLLAETVLSEAIGDSDVKIDWRPFELRPDPVPTLRPEDPYLPDIWRRAVYPLAARLDVLIRLPSLSPQPRTDKAFQLLAMAKDKGLAHAYSMRVMHAFFQENRDIGDPNVLADLASDSGLDRESARHVLETDAYAARHREAQRHAVEDARITSVPTIAIGRHRFTGARSVAELRPAIDHLVHEARSKTRPLSTAGE